jgi:hypothetical protein
VLGSSFGDVYYFLLLWCIKIDAHRYVSFLNPLLRLKMAFVCLVCILICFLYFGVCVGVRNEWDMFCVRLPGCQDPKPTHLTLLACQLDCKDAGGYDPAKSECKAGACCCHKWTKERCNIWIIVVIQYIKITSCWFWYIMRPIWVQMF